jgi:hypothetical protein
MNITESYRGPPGQQYPTVSYPPHPQKPKRPPAPRSLKIAVALMYAGLAGSVINMIIWAAGSGVIRREAVIADPAVAPGQVNGLVGAYAAVAVIIGLISAGLWVWMALANRYGQSWARIASTVLFGVYTLTAFGSFARPTITMPNGSTFDVPGPIAGQLTTWIIWLAGLAAIIAVWQRQSSAYYSAVKRHDPGDLAGQYPPYASYAAYPPYAERQSAALPPYGAGTGPSAYGFVPPGPPWYGPASPGPAQSPAQASPDMAAQPPQATPPPQT